MTTPTPASASTQIQQVDANNNAISTNPVLTAGQALTLYIKVSNISGVTLPGVSISITGSCPNVTAVTQTGAQDIAVGSFKQYLIEVSAPASTPTATCNGIRVTPSVGTGSATLRFSISGTGPTATPTPAKPARPDGAGQARHRLSWHRRQLAAHHIGRQVRLSQRQQCATHEGGEGGTGQGTWGIAVWEWSLLGGCLCADDSIPQDGSNEPLVCFV